MGLQNNKEEEVQWKERGKRKRITNIRSHPGGVFATGSVIITDGNGSNRSSPCCGSDPLHPFSPVLTTLKTMYYLILKERQLEVKGE